MSSANSAFWGISADDLLIGLIFVLLKSQFKDISFLIFLIENFTLPKRDCPMTIINY